MCTIDLKGPRNSFEAMHLLQEDSTVEPEHMLSKGLWEDVALPALKKVSVLKLCMGPDATPSFSIDLYELHGEQIALPCSALHMSIASALGMLLLAVRCFC